MKEENALALFKCLSDRSRLQICKSLAKEPMYVERLAERLDLSPSTVSFHLKKLEQAGMVTAQREQYYTIYQLREAILKSSILDILQEESEHQSEQEKREQQYRQKVLENFFVYGKLKNIPSQRKKRRIVLEEMVKGLEPGRHYTEKELNLYIADFHDDFCTLRREMVMEKLLVRGDGIYWLADSGDGQKKGRD